MDAGSIYGFIINGMNRTVGKCVGATSAEFGKCDYQVNISGGMNILISLIDIEIQGLILKLLNDPDAFTLGEIRDLEDKLAQRKRSKLPHLDLGGDQLMVQEGEAVEVL